MKADALVVWCVPDLDNASALCTAVRARKRLDSPEGQCFLAPTARGTVVAVRSRSYCLEAPKPWWGWVREWRP